MFAANIVMYYSKGGAYVRAAAVLSSKSTWILSKQKKKEQELFMYRLVLYSIVLIEIIQLFIQLNQ